MTRNIMATRFARDARSGAQSPQSIQLEFNVPVMATRPDGSKEHAASRLNLDLELTNRQGAPLAWPPSFPREAPVASAKDKRRP